MKGARLFAPPPRPAASAASHREAPGGSNCMELDRRGAAITLDLSKQVPATGRAGNSKNLNDTVKRQLV